MKTKAEIKQVKAKVMELIKEIDGILNDPDFDTMESRWDPGKTVNGKFIKNPTLDLDPLKINLEMSKLKLEWINKWMIRLVKKTPGRIKNVTKGKSGTQNRRKKRSRKSS